MNFFDLLKEKVTKTYEDLPEIKGTLNKKYQDTSNYVKEKTPQLQEEVNKKYQETKDYVKEKTPEVKKVITENYQVAKKTAIPIYNNYNNIYYRFNKIGRNTKYGLIFAGTCTFLFGLGYAMRPIADMYQTYGSTKKKDTF